MQYPGRCRIAEIPHDIDVEKVFRAPFKGGASTALGEIVSKDAIIVKMIRVIFIVPF